MSSVAYVLLALVATELSEDYAYMQQCAIGFSGVLFALKAGLYKVPYPPPSLEISQLWGRV